jgi:ABC-type nitrate/sulfonate/bicarbonate transport system substrate-binding protein
MIVKDRKKPLLVALAFALAAVGISACGSSASGAGGETTELRYQGFVGQVGFPELAADLGYFKTIKLKWIGNTISGPADIQAAATGQTEFGGAHDGAIIKLQAAGAPIKAVIGYYGADEKNYQAYYVLDGSPIRTPRDLIGKKVGVNTLGAHHEAVITTYLRQNGLSEDEIKKVELVVVPPVNTEQSLRAKQIDVGTLGGILQDKAVAAGGVRSLFSDFELFGTFTAGSIVLRKDFIAKNPNTTKEFVDGTARAIAWAQSAPRDEVIARFTRIVDARGQKEDTTALKYWKSTGVKLKGGYLEDSDFSRWFEWLEHSGQVKTGQVKPGDLYTNEYNPYRGEKP